MGGSQSIENLRAITTPGYKPKPPRQPTRASGVAGYGISDLVRTAANPGYRPKTPSALSGSPGGRIVAFDARFCSAAPMTLHLREKFWSLSGDDFTVKDAHSGAVWFKINGSVFSLREKKTLMDVNGVPIATMKAKLLALMPSQLVYAGGSAAGAPVVEIHCKITLFATDLRVSFVDRATGRRCAMGLEGDWAHRKASIWVQAGGSGPRAVVGRVSRSLSAARNLLLGAQDYYLEAAPGVDLALLTLVCVALDEAASD